MRKVKTYELYNESIFLSNSDEKTIKDIISKIKSGDIKYNETGGGRAPFARRNYYIFSFNVDGVNFRVEQSVRNTMLDHPKILMIVG